MKIFIFFTTFLVSIASGHVDEYQLVHYSKSKDELMECLENTTLSIVLNEYEDDLLKLKVLGELSDLMHEVTVPVEYIDVVASNLVNIIKQRSHLLHMQSVSMNNTNDNLEDDLVDLRKEIEATKALDATKLTFDEDEVERVNQTIIDALHECSDPEDLTTKISSYEIKPPRFIQEIPELAELLNIILVTRIWEISELSMYSQRSLQLIEAALDIMGNAQELFKELLNMWNRRVRLFFDGQKHREYFLSFYSKNRTVVFIDFKSYFPSRLRNNTFRDPPASQEKFVIEMTRYRASSFSNSASMTKSQYYLKFQVHQFFQMLFAYLESVDRGLTEDSEINEWIVFKRELRMLHYFFNDAYEAYLVIVQRRELSHEFARNSPIFSSLVRSLEPGDRIDEFDLVMMYWHRLRHVDVVTTTTPRSIKNWYNSFIHEISEFFMAGPSKSETTTFATTNTTTPSYTDSSSTPSYDESRKGKGPVTRLRSGKYVPIKQPRSSSNNNNDNSPSSIDKCQNPRNPNDMAENDCKFRFDPDDSKQSLLPGNNKIGSLELFQELFFTLLKGSTTSCEHSQNSNKVAENYYNFGVDTDESAIL